MLRPRPWGDVDDPSSGAQEAAQSQVLEVSTATAQTTESLLTVTVCAIYSDLQRSTAPHMLLFAAIVAMGGYRRAGCAVTTKVAVTVNHSGTVRERSGNGTEIRTAIKTNKHTDLPAS